MDTGTPGTGSMTGRGSMTGNGSMTGREKETGNGAGRDHRVRAARTSLTDRWALGSFRMCMYHKNPFSILINSDVSNLMAAIFHIITL